MFDQLLEQLYMIVKLMWGTLVHTWPYLLLTVPLAVWVKMSGLSKHIGKAFGARPVIAILAATVVGAFSPFCSCGVIPVVAGLLIGGVPLAPVMSFWLASPSMDPEIFFLSVSILGWELAVWRMVGTLFLSLSAGFVTQFFVSRGWLGEDILRRNRQKNAPGAMALAKKGWGRLDPTVSAASCGGSRDPQGCGAPGNCDDSGSPPAISFGHRLREESRVAGLMIIKFMLLAYFLEALIRLYVPPQWISHALGGNNPWAIFIAVGLGLPAYTTNLTALPLVGGLLAQGMMPAAGLAFLIAGATTTLPAMAAVWGLVKPRVFLLYLSLSLVGALAVGYIYLLVGGWYQVG